MIKRTPTDAAFEAFYLDARDRLLLQTWALTGNLPTAQKAVRDAFIVAAHHWRKLRKMPRPYAGSAGDTQEDWVRPVAWSRALGRHAVPHLGRSPHFDPETTATLDALAKLTKSERKVLILAHLSGVSIEQLARDAGISRVRAERELQTATEKFSHFRGVPGTGILSAFEPMANEAAQQVWPEADHLSRAGNHRRHGHTLIGAAATVVALVGSGLFVTQQADSSPLLSALSFGSPASASSEAGADQEDEYPLTSDKMLAPADIKRALGGKWETEITSDNRRGSGLVLPCQQRQFASADSVAALARTFKDPKDKNVTAGQAVEVSPSEKRAHTRFNQSLTWYAQCTETPVQLVSTQKISGLGDEATLTGLRDWEHGERSVVVGTARTGSVTTSVAATVHGRPRSAVPKVKRLLGKAVKQTSELPKAGAGAGKKQRTTTIPALAIGKEPQLLSEVDLPPVSGTRRPWVGTDPEEAKTNLAATGCDETTFGKNGMKNDLTRTFVIPGAKNLDPAFGLTESVGKFSGGRGAQAFMGTMRKKLDSCSDRKLGSDVTSLGSADRAKGRDSSIWRVEVETGKNSSVTYMMAAVRQGASVAQIGFVPSGSVTMGSVDFRALITRAADRLNDA